MNDRRDVARQRDASIPDARFEAYPDDEISLFDLWAVLVRRKGLMAAVFLLVLGLAFVFALLRPDVYTYSGSIAIGRILEGGSIVTVEPPTAVQAKLEQAYIPAVISERVDSAAMRAGIGIDAAAVEGSNIVTLSGEAPEDREARYLTLIEAAAQQVIAAHQERIDAVREATEATVRQLEETVSTYQALIDSLRERRAQIEAYAADLSERINELENGAGNGAAPQIERLMQTRDLILPMRAQALDEQMAELRMALAEARAELTALRTGLAAMEPSRLVGQPARSFRQSGPGGAVIVALGAVLGAMLAVFAAFVFEFVMRANSAIREGKAG